MKFGDVRKIPEILLIVEAVANDKNIRYFFPDVSNRHPTIRLQIFAQERTDLDAPRVTQLEHIGNICQSCASVYNIFNYQHIPVFDAAGQVVHDFDLPAGGCSVFVARYVHELDEVRNIELPNEVRQEYDATLEEIQQDAIFPLPMVSLQFQTSNALETRDCVSVGVGYGPGEGVAVAIGLRCG